MDFQILVAPGDSVKALPGGIVKGYAVTFGGADLVGDRFTAETDFALDGRSTVPMYYGHGQTKEIGKRRIGAGELTQDEVGLFYRAQLNLADAYEAQVYELAKQGKLGFSTGSASHLVERKDLGNGVSEILSWPICEVSGTVTPCEPRCRAVAPLKSFLDAEDEPQAGRSLADHSQQTLAVVRDFADRVQDLKSLRARDGRTLSERARDLVAETSTALEEVLAELKALTETPSQLASVEAANRLYAQFLEASLPLD